MAKILQLKIVLQGVSPPVWRRVLVEDTINFYRLHSIIQKVMGWANYHLFEFDQGGLSISIPDGDFDEEVKDAKKIKINKILYAEGQRIPYIYDFGDSWEHLIIVEKIVEKDSSRKYPVCLKGKMACPPEDCGGVWGYKELLKIRKNKNHPEYKEKIEDWLSEDFNSEYFDIDDVNRRLK